MSLNFTGRKTEADRIRLENMRLAKRIIQQKPVIRHKDLRKFERKHKLLLQNLTRPVNYTSYDYGLDDRFKKIKPLPGIAGLLTLHTDQLPEMPGLSPPPKARTSKESKSTSHLPALSSSNNPLRHLLLRNQATQEKEGQEEEGAVPPRRLIILYSCSCHCPSHHAHPCCFHHSCCYSCCGGCSCCGGGCGRCRCGGGR